LFNSLQIIVRHIDNEGSEPFQSPEGRGYIEARALLTAWRDFV